MTADLGKGSNPMHLVVPTRRVLLLAGPAALVLATAVACSSSTSPGTSTVATSGSSSGATSSGGAASSANALVVATNSSLGQIVTTGSGRTVYRFDADSTSPSKSNCTGGCSSLWPPVLATGSGTPAVMGVNSSQIGEVTRSDGSKQLTLAGSPLYTYSGDTAAGTAAGEGSGGTWWAVSPTGTRVKPGGGSGSTSSSPSSTGGGYGY
jgi:predicted lipoprotein with Yx(FWY)xxD motif